MEIQSKIQQFKYTTFEYFDSSLPEPKKNIPVFSFRLSDESKTEKESFLFLLERAINQIKTDEISQQINYKHNGISLVFSIAIPDQKEMYLALCKQAVIDVKESLSKHPELYKLE